MADVLGVAQNRCPRCLFQPGSRVEGRLSFLDTAHSCGSMPPRSNTHAWEVTVLANKLLHNFQGCKTVARKMERRAGYRPGLVVHLRRFVHFIQARPELELHGLASYTHVDVLHCLSLGIFPKAADLVVALVEKSFTLNRGTRGREHAFPNSWEDVRHLIGARSALVPAMHDGRRRSKQFKHGFFSVEYRGGDENEEFIQQLPLLLADDGTLLPDGVSQGLAFGVLLELLALHRCLRRLDCSAWVDQTAIDAVGQGVEAAVRAMARLQANLAKEDTEMSLSERQARGYDAESMRKLHKGHGLDIPKAHDLQSIPGLVANVGSPSLCSTKPFEALNKRLHADAQHVARNVKDPSRQLLAVMHSEKERQRLQANRAATSTAEARDCAGPESGPDARSGRLGVLSPDPEALNPERLGIHFRQAPRVYQLEHRILELAGGAASQHATGQGWKGGFDWSPTLLLNFGGSPAGANQIVRSGHCLELHDGSFVQLLCWIAPSRRGAASRAEALEPVAITVKFHDVMEGRGATSSRRPAPYHRQLYLPLVRRSIAQRGGTSTTRIVEVRELLGRCRAVPILSRCLQGEDAGTEWIPPFECDFVVDVVNWNVHLNVDVDVDREGEQARGRGRGPFSSSRSRSRRRHLDFFFNGLKKQRERRRRALRDHE